MRGFFSHAYLENHRHVMTIILMQANGRISMHIGFYNNTICYGNVTIAT